MARASSSMGMGQQARGVAYALFAALSFGASVPLLKRLGVDVAPITMAGLLYGGAAVALSVVRALFATEEAPLHRSDAPWLAGVVLAGAVAGPVLLLFGLHRASGVAASLLLNLEPALTVLLAVAFFREQASGKASLGIALLIAAGALLGLRGPGGGATIAGALPLAGACLAWALDNNLTQRLSLRDPVAVARWKAALGRYLHTAPRTRPRGGMARAAHRDRHRDGGSGQLWAQRGVGRAVPARDRRSTLLGDLLGSPILWRVALGRAPAPAATGAGSRGCGRDDRRALVRLERPARAPAQARGAGARAPPCARRPSPARP